MNENLEYVLDIPEAFVVSIKLHKSTRGKIYQFRNYHMALDGFICALTKQALTHEDYTGFEILDSHPEELNALS